jgi:hypothetical protein
MTATLFPIPAGRSTKGKFLEKLIAKSQVGVRLTQVPQAARVVDPRKWKGHQPKPGETNDPFTIRQRGPCDFFGTIVGSGRAIILDAKEGGDQNRLELRESHLPDHQRTALIDHGRAGAVAGIIALSTLTNRLYWCDWRLLLTEQSKRSLRWLDLAYIGPSIVAVNWGEVVKASKKASGNSDYKL